MDDIEEWNITEGNLASLVFDPHFDELEQSLDVYCPFDATGMVNAEIRHGHFLSTLLDPFRPHGYQSRFLREFLMAAAESSEVISPLDLHLISLDDAEVLLEYQDIDILVKLPTAKLAIPIELKIDAQQSQDQLKKYRERVAAEFPERKGWRHILVFLTKSGETPQDPAWIELTLSIMADRFEKVLGHQGAHPLARDMITAYLAMLRRRHMDDPRLTDLADKLWAKHRETLEFLMDQRPDELGSVFGIVAKDLKQLTSKLSQACKTNIEVDRNGQSFVRFAITDWDKFPNFKLPLGTDWSPNGRLVLLEIRRKGKNVLGSLVLGQGPRTNREAIFGMAKAANINVGNVVYDKYNSLVRKRILRLDDPDDLNVEKESQELESKFISFAQDEIKRFSTVFAPS